MKILRILASIMMLSIFVHAQTSVLTGTVYDATGAVIPKVKITVTNEKKENFETVTSGEGVYVLNLLYNPYDTKNAFNFKIMKYEIRVEKANGFDEFVLRDFRFIPSSDKGKMYFDFALDVYFDSNCGAGGSLPAPEKIELPETKISNEFLRKPLEKLPKD
jgi:hypothetical protein